MMVAPPPVVSLPNAPVSEQKDEKKEWERLPNEPARLFLIFTQYRLMGRKRSLQALTEARQTEQKALASPQTKIAKGKKGQTVEQDTAAQQLATVKPSVPGDIKAACKRWEWVKRAMAWDLYLIRKDEAAIELAIMDGSIPFARKSDRVMLLSSHISALEKHIEKPGTSFEQQMECFKLISRLLKQIQEEMLDYPFHFQQLTK